MKSTIAIAAISLAITTSSGLGATFSDSLGSTTLNPNLSIVTTSGFNITLPGGSALFTNDGTGNGYGQIQSNFTFSGHYVLTVDVFGLGTGLTDQAEAGLQVFEGTSFNTLYYSDIFRYNNESSDLSHNNVGASVLEITHVADGEDLLTISGITAVPLTLGIFLEQEYSGTAFNSVYFANLQLVADQFSPLPSAFPLFATGLGALVLLGWRRKRNGAATAAAHGSLW